MNPINAPRTTTIAITTLTVLLIGTLGWVYFERNVTTQAEKELKTQKLFSEEMLSEKLQVEKELEKTKDQISALQQKNEKLARSIDETSKANSGRDNTLARLQRENAANKKKYSELESAKSALELQLAALNNTMQEWQSQSNEQINTIAALQQANQNLKEELSRAHLAYYDKALVEALRGKNDKLMVKASRTQKLKVNVMIPSGLKEIQFKIIDPNGNILSSPDNGTVAVRTVDTGANTLTSTGTMASTNYKQIEMIYLPKRKLQMGIYQIEVMSENLAVGSLQVRLR